VPYQPLNPKPSRSDDHKTIVALGTFCAERDLDREKRHGSLRFSSHPTVKTLVANPEQA
jgi:hypothetical protein